MIGGRADVMIIKVGVRKMSIRTSGWGVAMAFTALAAAAPASAALVDLTTGSVGYNDGATFSPGIPPGWTNTALPNSLTIYNGTTVGDGPHNAFLSGYRGDFVATIDVSANSSSGYSGTFGGFYLDAGNGFFGITFGTGSIAYLYQINGQAKNYTALPTIGNSFDLELIRQGDTVTAAYSLSGTTFDVLFQLSGVTGTSQFDLTSYGAEPGLTANFSNFTVSPIPLPSALPTFGAALAGLVGFGTRRLRRIAPPTASKRR